jgi:hypothetical protein
MDEITLTRELGRETPLPSSDRLAPARARLMAELTAAAPALRPTPKTRKSRPRWAIIATGAVAAAAAGVASIFPGTPSSPRPAPGGGTQMEAVAQFLDDAAVVAAQAKDVVPRGDQFIYTRIVESGGARTEYWSSIDGEHLGRQQSGGKTIPLAACVNGKAYDPSDPVDVSCDPARLYLPDLPSDPDGVVSWLKRRNPGFDGVAHNVNGVAKDIWSLTSNYWLRPAQRAAVYRALGRFDGIRLVPGVTDAIGRTGTGVAWVSPGQKDAQVMWIFDPEKHVLLGSPDTAQEAFALVDKAGVTR